MELQKHIYINRFGLFLYNIGEINYIRHRYNNAIFSNEHIGFNSNDI